jgi:hypothetical protein
MVKVDKFGVLGGAISSHASVLNECGRREGTSRLANSASISTNRVRSWQCTTLIRAEDEDGRPTNHVCCDAPASTQRMFPLDVSSLLGPFHPSSSYMTITSLTCALLLTRRPAGLPMQVRRRTTLLGVLQLQHTLPQ